MLDRRRASAEAKLDELGLVARAPVDGAAEWATTMRESALGASDPNPLQMQVTMVVDGSVFDPAVVNAILQPGEGVDDRLLLLPHHTLIAGRGRGRGARPSPLPASS